MSESDVVLRIYLVRHGQTNENRKGITQGQMDTILNRLGHLEANKCGEALKNVVFTRAFSSDLTRAVQTAEAIMAYHPSVHIQKDELLRNRYKGEFQGTCCGFPHKSADPMESSELFEERLMSWWGINVELRLSLHYGLNPENILAVSHNACIKKLLSTLLEEGKIKNPPGFYKNHCYNTSVTIIEIGRDGIGILKKHCDVSHLRSIYYYDSDSESDTTEEKSVESSAESYTDEGDLLQINIDW